MSMFRSLFLGAVQGLTEFIPVSSSGHLVLVPFVLGWERPSGVAFDVAVHLGTALAVIVYFHRELAAIAVGAARTALRRGDEQDARNGRLALLLVVGSVPAAAAGLSLEGFFEGLFEEPQMVALLLLGTAALLLLGEAVYSRRDPGAVRDMSRVRLVDAVTIGLFQALAIAPGISRSGATISAGLMRGLARDAAARFAFLLGLPAFIGAGILKLPDFPPGTDAAEVLWATGVSAVAGLGAIAFLMRHLRTRTMRPFAVYCLFAAAIGIAFWFQVR